MHKLISSVLTQFKQDKCSSVAAELTLTSLLAFVPLVTLFFTILSMIPNYQALGGEIQDIIFDYFAPSAGESAQVYLAEFVAKAKGMSWLGFVMLFITALMMMKTIDQSFNHIWKIKRKHSTARTFLVYWAILTLGPLLLGTSLAVTSYIKSLQLLSNAVQAVSGWITLGLPFLLEFITFTLMFFIIPNRKIILKNALLASLFTTVLFEIAKFSFSMFIQYFSTYQLIFGALASIPLFLIWLYLSWSIILLGAELCNSLFISSNRILSDQNMTIRCLLVLQELSKEQAANQSTEQTTEQSGAISINSDNTDCLERLENKRIIARMDDQSYCLKISRFDLTYESLFNLSGRQLPTVEEIERSELVQAVKDQMLRIIEKNDELLKDVIQF